MTSSPQLESRWPHRLAVVLVCATFPLIWVGGLVTTYDAGMAVDDWPGTFGHNLLLYPWHRWITGPFDLFIEHGHRLLGAAVGIFAIAFVIVVFRCDKRPWMRYAALAALGLVIFQGALGGARVLFDERQLALLHGCVGPAFFAYAVALVALSHRRPDNPVRQKEQTPEKPVRHSAADQTPNKIVRLTYLPMLACVTTLLAYGQLFLGANLRHLPIAASPSFFRAVLLFHLLVAALLVLHAGSLVVTVIRRHARQGELLRPALGLCCLLALQLALGGGTWVVKYGWPDWFAGQRFAEAYVIEADGLVQAYTVTAHVAIGSLILGVSTMLSVQAVRLVTPAATSGIDRGRWLFFGPCNFQFNSGRPKTQPRPHEGFRPGRFAPISRLGRRTTNRVGTVTGSGVGFRPARFRLGCARTENDSPTPARRLHIQEARHEHRLLGTAAY